jgi:hypothetical protein
MKQESKTLHLTLEAGSAEDFRMLLKQALYEIEKHLPAPPDSSFEVRQAAAARTIFDDSVSTRGQTATGNADGTLGHYSFELVSGPVAYAELEKKLLREGYVRGKHASHGYSRGVVYRHNLHGVKEISGDPLEVRDFVPKKDPFDL